LAPTLTDYSITADREVTAGGLGSLAVNLPGGDGRKAGVAKSFTIDNVASMHPIQRSFRVLAWCCAALLAVLSLLPAEDMVRTGMLGELEHLVAYGGSASIAIAGYGRGSVARIIGLFWMYAGLLEYLHRFSPGRHPSMLDFAASALGAFFGGFAAARFVPRRVEARLLGNRLI
jgi:VanZ family protein